MQQKPFLLTILFFFLTYFSQSQEYLRMIDAGTYPVQEIIDTANDYFDGKDKGRGSGYKQFKRWEYNALIRVKEDGFLPTIDETLAELQAYNNYLNQTAHTRQPLPDNWEELGPLDWEATTSWNPGVGRITGIAIDKINSDHIIVGANTGGVWRTLDGGATWTPLSDYFSNLYVYSVAIDPADPDVYFFGSSGGRIFKSTDAGATWSQMGTIGNSSVNKILIHPSNSDVMFATAGNAGIYRSTNGAVSWTNTGLDSQGFDIEFKPGDPTVVYASGSGFHKSIDGGAGFVTINGFSGGPKMIGISPADASVVYVVEADSGKFGGLYKSENSGDSFIELDHGTNNYFGYSTTASDNSGQAPRDMDIAVHPGNSDEVHIAGILTWRSLDGGVTFTCTSDWIPNSAMAANIGYCHADVDILEFNGATLFAGTDGGIFKAEDTATISSDYYTDITTGMGIRQFYKIGVSQTSEVVITGGSQDNGTSFYTPATGWKDWLGADGMEGFVDKDNTDVMYGMIQFGGMYRTDNAANSIVNIGVPGAGSGEWVTPFEQDPEISNTIYAAYNRVYRSANKGSSWTPISQSFGGNLDHLKIAPSNNQVMYTSNGAIFYRTLDGGATDWQTMTSPGGVIHSIAIHPSEPDRIAVAMNNINKVGVSLDGGLTWENYRFNLPNFSARAVVWDNNGANGLYLGMDYGIYYIDNTLDEWQPYNNNLPNVSINELEINEAEGLLYAATYGRGLWVSPLADLILSTPDRVSQEQVILFPNPVETTFQLLVSGSLQADIRVFDMGGKLIMYQNDTAIQQVHTIDVSGLQAGVYFIRISSENGTLTKKIIKK